MSYEDQDEDYSVGSFPKGFGYGDSVETDLCKENSQRILLMGMRRSGKSSIQKVVFQKMSPNETLFLESTNKVIKEDICNSAFVNFQLWDLPGQTDFLNSDSDIELVFGMRGSLIYVIDAQDEYLESLNKLHMIITKAYEVNHDLRFEVFIHKVDGLTEDSKMEAQRDIVQRVTDDLSDSGNDNLHLSFHLTSIYDHSIFEAFSKVVQKLIPHLAVMENLLNTLTTNSAIEKAFLFDVISKMYVATDSSPVDMQSYELCCDMIDVVIDISCIYGTSENYDMSTFDNKSSTLIYLNNGTILYLKEVSSFLALVCILREENFERQGVIDYNVMCFREAIQKLLSLMTKQRQEEEKHENQIDTRLECTSLPT